MLAFESRRAVELEKLIRRNGGVPVVVPSMREVPLEENAAAFEFLDRLESGAVDVVIMLTGVGVRTLVGALAVACPPDRLAEKNPWQRECVEFFPLYSLLLIGPGPLSYR